MDLDAAYDALQASLVATYAHDLRELHAALVSAAWQPCNPPDKVQRMLSRAQRIDASLQLLEAKRCGHVNQAEWECMVRMSHRFAKIMTTYRAAVQEQGQHAPLLPVLRHSAGADQAYVAAGQPIQDASGRVLNGFNGVPQLHYSEDQEQDQKFMGGVSLQHTAVVRQVAGNNLSARESTDVFNAFVAVASNESAQSLAEQIVPVTDLPVIGWEVPAAQLGGRLDWLQQEQPAAALAQLDLSYLQAEDQNKHAVSHSGMSAAEIWLETVAARQKIVERHEEQQRALAAGVVAAQPPPQQATWLQQPRVVLPPLSQLSQPLLGLQPQQQRWRLPQSQQQAMPSPIPPVTPQAILMRPEMDHNAAAGTAANWYTPGCTQQDAGGYQQPNTQDFCLQPLLDHPPA